MRSTQRTIKDDVGTNHVIVREWIVLAGKAKGGRSSVSLGVLGVLEDRYRLLHCSDVTSYIISGPDHPGKYFCLLRTDMCSLAIFIVEDKSCNLVLSPVSYE